MKPRIVADGICRALAMPLDPITFAPLRRSDLEHIVAWQNADHVRCWWTDAITDVDSAEKKYGPCIDGMSPTEIDIIFLGNRPVGAGFRRVFDFETQQGAPRHALCVFDRNRVVGYSTMINIV